MEDWTGDGRGERNAVCNQAECDPRQDRGEVLFLQRVVLRDDNSRHIESKERAGL